ncbi:hypothetical protein HLB01_08875 [Bordetella trematum]|nr:hypothetical protein [Bordetella trematum]NNH19145.1 hypothetical protein [Bordetella trematum]
MAKYNTGNPMGSKSPKDLSDNAQNLDDAVNDLGKDTWLDRFGKTRVTLSGYGRMFSLFIAQSVARFQQFMTNAASRFEQFLISSGYQDLGDYRPGLKITERNQIFWKDGELYRAGARLGLPYTTTGDWADESSDFVSIGDAALRQELGTAGPGVAGAAIVAFESDVAGAVPRTVEEKLFEVPTSADDIGAAGDGVSDDTVFFAALEAGTSGQPINLLGRTFAVSALPNGNDYFNGAFVVAGQYMPQHNLPQAHPWANPAPHFKAISAGYDAVRGLNAAFLPLPSTAPIAYRSQALLIWREGRYHTFETTSSIKMARTYDAGSTLFDEKVIFKDAAGLDARNMNFAFMGGTRIGVFAGRYSASAPTSQYAPVFLYSDDFGANWSSVVLTLPSGALGGSPCSPSADGGVIHRYPASVGGHDTDGWITYVYGQTGNNTATGYFVTLDNGLTWTFGAIFSHMGPERLTETSVCRVGAENKWLMVIRDNRVATAPAYLVSKSTNMVDWEPWVASASAAGRNPPALIYDRGSFYLFAPSRQAREILMDRGSQLLYMKVNARAAFEDPVGIWNTPWRDLGAMTYWPTGPLFMHRDERGRWFGLFQTGETGQAGADQDSLQMVLISNSPTVTADAKEVVRLIPKRNIFVNGDFQIWNEGTTRESAAGRVFGPERWSLGRTSSPSTGASISRVDGVKRQFATRLQRIAGDTNSAGAVNFGYTFELGETSEIAGKAITVGFDIRRSPNMDSHIFLRFSYSTSSSEQAVTALNGTFTVGNVTASDLAVPVDPFTRHAVFRYDIPLDAKQVRFSVLMTGGAAVAGADHWVDIEGFYGVLGQVDSQPLPRSIAEDSILCARHCNKTYGPADIPGAVTDAGALQERSRGAESSAAVNMVWRFPIPMRATPTVTVFSTTGASGNLRNVTGGGDVPAIADAVGQSGATIINNAAVTSGAICRAHALATARL